ncbi:TonB-dependent receptor [Occallatibacter riparius]|uniref:TonB-dependent receptor n=1 Tax=Occallatibacter riparius TaxID=1002689 RepID=A0A9J7BHK3_9BACT|nr:TonB-dependent receptor [Occallatibacter riparius]UWZ82272.1 TonB-dependent receptor [Occallatibacter riparius]
MRLIDWQRGFLLSCILLLSALGNSQAPGTGAIRGMIYDPAGRTVPNATVSVEQQATHALRSTISDAAGAFEAPLLAPGNYVVRVSADGFAQSRSQAIAVVVSETSSVEIRLALAAAKATVEVTANEQIATTESSALGRAVDEQAITALPLSNRNFTQILSLSPGVTVGLPDATQPGRGTQDVIANGGKTTANNIQFNGVDANNLAQNSAASDGEEVGVAVPAPDTIQEFKVQTGNYDATYGRGTGANVDVVSRTGTNRFHGTAWEFLRNDALNANDFFSKLTGQPRPVLKQNQFGAALGGPILRNKTFFFVAYQGLRSSNGVGTELTTFLPQLTSDRSAATLGAQFCAYPTAAGGTQLKCNGSNINPVALKLLNFKLPNGQFAVPSPQILLPADPGQMPIGESTYATPATYNEDQYTGDFDHSFSNKNTASARLFYSRAPTVNPFSPNAANVPGWGTNEVDKNVMVVASDTHVVNSNLINVGRLGYMRFDGKSSVEAPILASDVGTQSPTGLAGPGILAPGVTVDGLFTIGDAGTPSQTQRTNSYIAQDTVSLTRRRNFIRFGAEVKRHQVMIDAPFAASGLLDIRTFSDFLLGQSAQQNGSPNGLSNVTSSGGSSGIFRKDERYSDFATFVQDDVKLTPSLTINAGLRYEVFGPPSEIHGRLVTFDPTIATLTAPATGTLSGFVVASNFPDSVPQGVKQTDRRGVWPTRYTDVSPRFGFAYHASNHPDLVVRGGYGIYFDRLAGGLAENLVSQPPFSTIQLFSGSQNGGASLTTPFNPLLPSAESYPIFIQRIPAIKNCDPSTSNCGGGPTVVGLSTKMVDPYTQEYNLNVQVGMGWNTLAEIGYVGTRTLHVAGCAEFNQSLLASASAPVYGETINSAGNVVLRAPYQGIAPGSLECATAYDSNYNGLQASATKRLSKGLQFLGSYTWSRTLDQTSGSSGSQVFELWLLTNDQRNPRQSYGPTDFDRTHRGVFSFTYDIPGARTSSAFVRTLTSNWLASGILVLQSGTPITVLDFGAGAVYGNYPFENRAQLSGKRIATPGSLYSRVIGTYLDANGFTDAPLAPNAAGPGDTDFGNSGVGVVRGPGQRNMDLAIERTIPILEQHSVHVRGEFFNLTNTPNFANPLNIVNFGPAFGKITTKSNNPRIIQIALKYQF